MVRYIPVQAAENRKLAAVTKNLQSGLRDAETGGAQREALETYRAALLTSVGVLERSPAPEVLEPSRTGGIARLQSLARLARQLGRALADPAGRGRRPPLPRFVQMNASTGTTPAERRAVIAFNSRLRRLRSSALR